MELDSRKKSRRDRMMRSNSFETQEVRKVGRKEAGESRRFPILWMGIMKDVFQIQFSFPYKCFLLAASELQEFQRHD